MVMEHPPNGVLWHFKTKQEWGRSPWTVMQQFSGHVAKVGRAKHRKVSVVCFPSHKKEKDTRKCSCTCSICPARNTERI